MAHEEMNPVGVAETPRIETYAGRNNAYRGTEQHGVPFDVSASAVDLEYDGMAVDVHIPDDEPAPVPVRIVNTGGQEIDKWDGDSFTLTRGRVASLVAPRMPSRTSLTVTNKGPDNLYLVPDADKNNPDWAAVVLEPDSSWSLANGAEVYGFVENGESAKVRIAWEFTVTV